MVDFDAADKARDRRLRRLLLLTLHNARNAPTGELGAQTLVDVVDASVAPDQRFEDEEHSLRLIRDLINKGLAVDRMLTRKKYERFGLRFLVMRVTDQGSRLINETLAADPDIDDERITEET